MEKTLWDIEPGQRSLPVIKELMKIVSDMKFFKDLPQEVIEQLCGYLRRVTYQKQHFVFEEGDVGPFTFYIVRGGIVSIIRREKTSSGVIKETTVARLHTGDAFGEGSVKSGLPRSACIKTEQITSLLELSTLDYLRILKKHEEGLCSRRLETIARCTVFAQWSKEQLHMLASSAMVQRYEMGQTIIPQGGPIESLCIIKRGVVKVICEVAIPKKSSPTSQYSSRNQNNGKLLRKSCEPPKLVRNQEHIAWPSITPGSSLRKCQSTGAIEEKLRGGRPNTSPSFFDTQEMGGARALKAVGQEELHLRTSSCNRRPHTASVLQFPSVGGDTKEADRPKTTALGKGARAPCPETRSASGMRTSSQATSNRRGIHQKSQCDYLASEKPGYWLLSFGEGLQKTIDPSAGAESKDFANRGTSLGNMSATLRSSLFPKQKTEEGHDVETFTRKVEIARLASPQLFGELILLDPLRRSEVSFVSETAVDLVVISKAIFHQLQAQVCNTDEAFTRINRFLFICICICVCVRATQNVTTDSNFIMCFVH